MSLPERHLQEAVRLLASAEHGGSGSQADRHIERAKAEALLGIAGLLRELVQAVNRAAQR